MVLNVSFALHCAPYCIGQLANRQPVVSRALRGSSLTPLDDRRAVSSLTLPANLLDLERRNGRRGGENALYAISPASQHVPENQVGDTVFRRRRSRPRVTVTRVAPENLSGTWGWDGYGNRDLPRAPCRCHGNRGAGHRGSENSLALFQGTLL